MSLNKFSTLELEQEINHRKEEERGEAHKKRCLKNSLLLENREGLLALFARHRNNRCTDDNVIGDIFHNGAAHCVRCFLLRMNTNSLGWYEMDLQLNIREPQPVN